MSESPGWSEEYDGAPSIAPANSDELIADSEDELRALGCALKPTGKAAGAVSAGAMAGLVLAGLRSAGWDVTRAARHPQAGTPGFSRRTAWLRAQGFGFEADARDRFAARERERKP